VAAYILRRLLLMIPTLFGIMLINFIIIQFAPGGPVERVIAQLTGSASGALNRGGAGGSDFSSAAMAAGGANNPLYRGRQGLDPEFIKELNHQFGFDKPPVERFFDMVGNYLTFNFGQSYYRSVSVVDLILEKMPVSISLGLWTTLLTYLVSIPLGIAKAVRDGTRFDVATSAVIAVGYAVPSFLFAILLIVLFAGGNYVNWFPLRGIVSENWHDLSWPARIADYLWHMTLPITAMTISGFATTTLLTKNSFLEEIRKQYVVTAKAKGLSEERVLYGHVFRNAMLLVISGFPGAFIGIFFTGSILIEQIFTLDGIGLLSYESALNRDYPVVFATLYIFSLIGLLTTLLSDLTLMLIDPRIDFETRGR
jgi:microcin C transport system permease protein